MAKSINLPVLGRVDTNQALKGAAILAGLMLVPKVSDVLISGITKVRNMISGRSSSAMGEK